MPTFISNSFRHYLMRTRYTLPLPPARAVVRFDVSPFSVAHAIFPGLPAPRCCPSLSAFSHLPPHPLPPPPRRAVVGFDTGPLNIVVATTKQYSSVGGGGLDSSSIC